MFSKKYFSAAMILAVITTSCTPKLGESPPEITQQKIEGTQCLAEIKPVVGLFLKGEASDYQVAQGWDCASLSIKKFKQYVYGRSEDRYTSKELADFLKDNFFSPGGPGISDELRLQFMKLKQLFIGGSTDAVTRVELDKILGMLGDLKSMTLRLNPYMSIVAQNWAKKQTRDSLNDTRYFEKASDEIQAVASQFANVVLKNNQSYELDDFVIFIKEFSEFYGENWNVADQIADYMPVVKKVKKAIAGGDQNVIAGNEWNSFVLIGVRGYVQYLRYFYFIKSAPETGSAIRLGYLARSLEDLFGSLQDLVQVKPVDATCGTQGQKNLSCISKAEIMDILQAFAGLWSEFHISPKLLDESMKLKKMYFGGTTDNITSLDFERGKKKVAGLKLVVEKFLPYYSIYSMEWDRGSYDYSQAQQFFKEAQNSLISSAADFGGLFEDSYDLQSLVSLLSEVDVLYPNKNPDKKLAETVSKYLPLVRDAKNVVFSENDSLIKKTQWTPFLKFGSRFYSSYLYYVYFIEKEQYGSSRFLDSFGQLTNQVLDEAKDIVLAKKEQKISEAEVRMIAQHLVELGVLPKDLSAQSIDQLVKLILNRVLWPAESRLKGANPSGITAASIENMRNEFQIWYVTESYGLSLTANPLKPADLQNALAKKLKDPKNSASLQTGLTEISMLIAGPVAQTVGSDHHQIISNQVRHAYGPLSFSQSNLNRALGRLLIRAATTSRTRLDNYQGVNLSEALALYNPVRPAFVELQILAPDNLTFMDSRFRDANIFTAHGNGDDMVNFAEMGDIVGMILSGVQINSEIRVDIDKKCLARGTVVDLNTTVAEKCLRKVYLDRIDNYFTATPEFLKFFRITDHDEFDGYMGNVLKAAGQVPNAKGTIKLTDSDLAPHVVQYLEMLFARFDDSKDGVITTEEAKNAFPAFRGILTELTKDQSLIKQKDLLALFMYILHYGKPPGGVKDFVFKWLPWKSNPDTWNVSVNRSQLADILGYIADQAAKTNKSLISAQDQEAILHDPNYHDDGR